MDQRFDASSSAPTRRHKFSAPGLPRNAMRRPRLDRLMTELFATYSIVELVSAPGSGKTVQAQLFLAECARPSAWLTLDRADESPMALVMDLCTALEAVAGSGVRGARATVRTNGTPEEAAAVLSESLACTDCVFVIDECQQIARSPAAASALDSFLAYLPERAQILLLARAELPWPLRTPPPHGVVGHIGDGVLDLTPAETADFVSTLGSSATASDDIFDATGGWVAGVALASRFGLGSRLSINDVTEYFEKQVLDHLPRDEQQFLLDMSVADAVTPELATALHGAAGARLLSAVSGRHLPAATTFGSTITLHSLFRTFLDTRLRSSQPERHHELHARYGDHLTATGQFEQATEAWIELGELDKAADTGRRALPMIYERADWTLVARWTDSFGEDRVRSDPILLGAHLRAVFGLRQYDTVRTLVRKADREQRLRAAIEADPALLATVAWAMQASPQEAMSLLDRYHGDPRADVVRYMIGVLIGSDPRTPPEGSRPADVERNLSWGLFIQGRLGELAGLGPDDDAPVLNPNIILAAAFREDVRGADRMWLRVPQEIRHRPQSLFVRAMIDIARGAIGEARDHLRTALADSRRSGFSMSPVYEIHLGYVQLVDDRPVEAVNLLEPVLDRMSRSGQTAYAEMARCFLGLAYLCDERLADARVVLRETTASMAEGHRRLLLPTAAAALSEVEARLGRPEAAHQAASLAYRVAELTGSLSGLVRTVQMFPNIRLREIQRAPAEQRWRRLMVTPSVRATDPAQPTGSDGLSLRLQPFGREGDLFVEGTPTRISRTKLLELVACLALHKNGIDRTELQQLLFPESDPRNGGNHFRQISHKLRHEAGVALERRGNLVVLPGSVSLVADDIESERLLANASSVTGTARIERLRACLELVPGRYLERSTLAWVEERRTYLELVYEEARLELAALHLEAGRPDLARTVVETALDQNPYSDPAYRLLVQIERRVGSELSAAQAYEKAAEALAELGLRPGDARRLLRSARYSVEPDRPG